MKKEKILVFIPAYNCSSQIARVLMQFKEVDGIFSEILIVDNRSTDTTIASAVTAAALLTLPVTIVKNNNNYGLGGSHKVAFSYAIDHGFDYVVVLHGDDQGNIQDLLPHLRSGEHRNHDCLLGARFMTGSQLHGYSHFRTFGNFVFNTLFSIAAGRRLHDLGSGLNLYKVENLREGGYLGFENNLTFNYSMILASVGWKWNIKFFPISWREDDQISNVKLVNQSMQVMAILLRYMLRRKEFFSGNFSGRARDAYGYEVVQRNAENGKQIK